mmetsp:Transcript_64146/g.180550  ORF Transcript_64146/g.180550 Transcript_64146/m.180550 type:complete len:220 (+) Transcript_64146:188-847(+)
MVVITDSLRFACCSGVSSSRALSGFGGVTSSAGELEDFARAASFLNEDSFRTSCGLDRGCRTGVLGLTSGLFSPPTDLRSTAPDVRLSRRSRHSARKDSGSFRVSATRSRSEAGVRFNLLDTFALTTPAFSPGAADSTLATFVGGDSNLAGGLPMQGKFGVPPCPCGCSCKAPPRTSESCKPSAAVRERCRVADPAASSRPIANLAHTQLRSSNGSWAA